MQKWIIHLSLQEFKKLDQDFQQLGELLITQEGKHLLVFRDRFVALKVASSLGLEPQLGKPEDSAPQGSKQQTLVAA